MSYEEAQRYAFEAERHVRAGDVPAARDLFLKAAELEWGYVQSLPADRRRTRAVFGLNSATHFFQANQLDQAERIASYLLMQDSLEPYSHNDVRNLLQRVWNERLMQSLGLTLSRQMVSLVFHGAEIGAGLAPPEAVDTPISAALKFLRCVAAFKSGLPVERRVPPVLKERYRAWITPPLPGSYRIDVYLASQDQLSFDFPDLPPPAPADDVMETGVQLLRAISRRRADEIRSLVPEGAYRPVLIQLARQLVPDGRTVSELEVRAAGREREEAIVLHEPDRAPITDLLRDFQPTPVGSSDGAQLQEETVQGVLRAVDLDKRRLQIDHPDRKPTPLRIGEEIPDDVLGAYLNKEVQALGYHKPRLKTLIVRDIDFATQAPGP